MKKKKKNGNLRMELRMNSLRNPRGEGKMLQLYEKHSLGTIFLYKMKRSFEGIGFP